MEQSRTRLVNFRVTDEEYQQLQEAWIAAGAPHLSEFARCTVLGAVRDRLNAEPSEPAGCRIQCDVVLPPSRFPELQRVLESLLRAVESAEPETRALMQPPSER